MKAFFVFIFTIALGYASTYLEKEDNSHFKIIRTNFQINKEVIDRYLNKRDRRINKKLENQKKSQKVIHYIVSKRSIQNQLIYELKEFGRYYIIEKIPFLWAYHLSNPADYYRVPKDILSSAKKLPEAENLYKFKKMKMKKQKKSFMMLNDLYIFGLLIVSKEGKISHDGLIYYFFTRNKDKQSDHYCAKRIKSGIKWADDEVFLELMPET